MTHGKEAGPKIFVQSHALIFPSGALDDDPSNEVLSVGKVITCAGTAMAGGMLLLFLEFSHDFSFFSKKKYSCKQAE